MRHISPGSGIFDYKNVFIVCDVEGKLNEWILKFRQTLFIIDDCSAEGEINKKNEMHYHNLLLD